MNHYSCKRDRKGVMRARVEIECEFKDWLLRRLESKSWETTHSDDQAETSEIIHSFQTLFLTLTLSFHFIIYMDKDENSRDNQEGNLDYRMSFRSEFAKVREDEKDILTEESEAPAERIREKATC